MCGQYFVYKSWFSISILIKTVSCLSSMHGTHYISKILALFPLILVKKSIFMRCAKVITFNIASFFNCRKAHVFLFQKYVRLCVCLTVAILSAYNCLIKSANFGGCKIHIVNIPLFFFSLKNAMLRKQMATLLWALKCSLHITIKRSSILNH